MRGECSVWACSVCRYVVWRSRGSKIGNIPNTFPGRAEAREETVGIGGRKWVVARGKAKRGEVAWLVAVTRVTGAIEMRIAWRSWCDRASTRGDRCAE